MGVSRQAYYLGLRRQAQREERGKRVLERVREKRLWQPRLGTRKLHHLITPVLEESDLRIGRDALFDLLRHARMLVLPRRAYHKTTDSHHRFRRHPNLLKAGTAKSGSRPASRFGWRTSPICRPGSNALT